MLEPGSRWEYVIAAYLATGLILGLLVLVSAAAARRAKRDLDAVEARGGPRRRRAE
jgi:heme exporter protein CcmD